MNQIEILLVEDQVLFRRGLKVMLKLEADLAVEGEASSAEEALVALGLRNYSMVITDLTLPDRDGLWLIRRLHEEYPNVAVLVISMHENPRAVERTFEAGASGYVLKTAKTEQLLEAVRTVAQGQRYLQPELLRESSPTAAREPLLSLFDLEILHYARRGLETERIRSNVNLSPSSFDSRVRSLCRKLQATDLSGAVKRALEESLLVSDTH
jgi:DNA-binding NarL/FixJ family response regulator